MAAIDALLFATAAGLAVTAATILVIVGVLAEERRATIVHNRQPSIPALLAHRVLGTYVRQLHEDPPGRDARQGSAGHRANRQPARTLALPMSWTTPIPLLTGPFTPGLRRNNTARVTSGSRSAKETEAQEPPYRGKAQSDGLWSKQGAAIAEPGPRVSREARPG
jgi:hypothetical protein